MMGAAPAVPWRVILIGLMLCTTACHELLAYDSVQLDHGGAAHDTAIVDGGRVDGGIADGAADSSPADGGPRANWREVNLERWTIVARELSDAAALGATGPATVALEGEDLGTSSKWKWQGGALAPNGRIYAVPFDAEQVLEIDPTRQPLGTRLVGTPLGARRGKWAGAALGANGRIYAAPFMSDTVLVIDPATEPPTVATISSPLLSPDAKGWSVLVRATESLIVGIPAYAVDFLLIDTSTTPATISRFGDLEGIASSSTENWGGGALSPTNGKIYAVPYTGASVLEIDPLRRSAATVGPPLPGKWFGAALASNGKIYGVPETGGRILEIDPTTVPVGVRTFGVAATSSDGAALAPSGRIYSCPWNGPTIAEIHPTTSTVATIEIETIDFGTVGPAFAGGVLAPNGKIYCLPVRSPQVLVIDPKARGTLNMDTLLSPYVNLY